MAKTVNETQLKTRKTKLSKKSSEDTTQTSTWSKKEEKVDNQKCVKSVYDVEPKFKAGDWIVFTNGNVERIISVGTYGYTFDDGDYLLHDKCDKDAHLWNIQDAKNGDVLANDHHILILKELVYDWSSNRTPYSLKAYCGIKPNGNFEIGKDNWSFCGILHIQPATKEQRDTLFAKMKEAGYAFNFEEKELKKLGQSEVTKTSDQEEIAEISFGAKDSELQEATYHIPKGFHAEIDGDKVVIKKDEKLTAWSDEDERNIQNIDAVLFYDRKLPEDTCVKLRNFLKTLKERIGG